jgi:nucleosome binding factor SPN SPT16 subunit
MEAPVGYEGPQIEIFVRDPKTETASDISTKILAKLEAKAIVGLFLKDKEDGDLTKSVFKIMEEKTIVKEDMKDFMDRVHAVKIKEEINNVQIASKFAKWTFENLINAVEDIIENE